MPGYISEISYKDGNAVDFVEVAVPEGTDVSGYTIQVYSITGALWATYSFGASTQMADQKDVYLFDNSTTGWGGIGTGQAVAIVDDLGNVVQFVSFGGTVTAADGDANGLTSTDIGTTSKSGDSLQSDNGGTSYYIQETPNSGTIPCYAPGTLIDTPDGPRAVETLNVGDLVTTLDHGPQPIRWVRSGDQPLEAADTDAKPVLISSGALGGKLPAQDLIVSPQHRILVGGHRQLQGRFETEAFALAKSLIKLQGIRHMKGKQQITWIHFACDRHEVVTANGCLSESLLLGPMVVNGMTAAERQVVIDVFGEAQTPDAPLNGPPVRECLKVGVVRRQLAKCSEEKEKLVAKEIKNWDVDAAMERYETERLREANAKSQVGMRHVA